MALIARNVLRHGRSSGVATAVGVSTGTLGWAAAAAVGVSTILATSATLFTALKIAGAIYLVYLGITTLRQPDLHVETTSDRTASQPWRTAWLQGLLSALLNPKLGVFFLTLLPQFIRPDEDAAIRAMQLALVFDADRDPLAARVRGDAGCHRLHPATARPATHGPLGDRDGPRRPRLAGRDRAGLTTRCRGTPSPPGRRPCRCAAIRRTTRRGCHRRPSAPP